MRHKIISTLLILALVVLIGSGYTQTMRKTGSSGAAILKVAIGARATAMANAMTSEVGDVNLMFWNPAGISIESGKTQVTFSYNNWIADISHNAFGVSHSLGNWGTIAVGGMMAGIDGIEAFRDTQAGLDKVTYNTDPTFDFNASFFQLTYAKQFTDKLSLGVSAKWYSETIDGDGISAIAADFGAVYKIGYRDLAIGARIQNIGSDPEYFYVPFSLPMSFSFGASMSVVKSDFFALKAAVDATKPLDAEQLIFTGLEAALYNNVFLRTGYKFNYMGVTDEYDSRQSYQVSEQVYRKHWWDRETYSRTDEGMSVGAGVSIPYSDYCLVVDYAWTNFELMDNVNRFSLTFKF
ncbi:PorV/PorQ family protein [candidate division KSB1 bacterium]|nr:PorV/PorQ family protein [candidate division KSB1 bacterium]